jgi:hypothetical protein
MARAEEFHNFSAQTLKSQPERLLVAAGLGERLTREPPAKAGMVFFVGSL